MKFRISLSTFTLISLLSLYSFAVDAGAQPYTFNRLGGSPKLQGETGKTHQAQIAKPAFSYGLVDLYSFCAQLNCSDGGYPVSGLIQDDAGNFYGTTAYGGANREGTVFELDSTGHETVLYSFCSVGIFPNCTDGYNPYAGLIQDAA